MHLLVLRRCQKNYKIIILFALLIFINCSQQEKNSIKISSASSLSSLLDSISLVLNKEYSLDCINTFGASGILANQIINNVKSDIFISADYDIAQKVKSDLKIKNELKLLCSGSIAIFSRDLFLFDSTYQFLLNDSIKRIIIPNIKTSPYGKRIHQLFKTKGIEEKLSKKIVYAESAQKVFHLYLNTDNCIAITAHSLKNKLKETDYKTFIPLDNPDLKIDYYYLRLNNSKNAILLDSLFQNKAFDKLIKNSGLN
ncbi:MAG: molybdate ABC transporter substrate-binding protein [Cytophagales bacterium]|nr:MAG: molybdate ABC transporter substrate-binding protein [Cytophagales bacterium]TAF62286.1 MAG: molybdate ABC transporter substrate-binding protein [Cytophagales bacterium]